VVLVLLVAFAVSVVITMLLVRSAKMHGRHSGDRDFSKPQKFHAVSVPRIGGLGILLGLIGATAVIELRQQPGASELALLLLCAMPAFLAGIVHDFTEALTPRGRLVATAVSAWLAHVLLGATIRHTDIPGLDWLVSFGPAAALVTVVAVAGMANSVNIIDGFNGLASMCVVLMLGALCYVAFQVNDPLIGTMALAGIGAVLGFFLWNFPAGLIFLGDGGAYFLGFFVAEVSILLLHRHPDEVSPLFPLLVCIYPLFETVFSIYRRRLLRAASPTLPDGIHLHSLIYRRMLQWAVGSRNVRSLTRRNSMTSPYLWVLCMLSVAPAVLLWDNTAMLAGALLLFIASYLVLYWRIVRFRAPRWMRAPGGTRPTPLDLQQVKAGKRRG
jgi:UDP-N-acetylmuramyl pentapeptide phosphotransferase/UDP-N-acetylglucosamine-1-phosphate transferase